MGGARHYVDDVVSYLARHRIKAEARVEAPLLGSTGADQIIGLALDEGADLLVTGAYGHSRLNEWIFGGMTPRPARLESYLLSDVSLRRRVAP
jgi:nucleotide-binding universal stress UspA family protein